MPPRDLRRLLADAWEQLDSEQREEVERWAADAWRLALTASKGYLVKGIDIVCKDCGHKRLYDVPFEGPDLLTQVKALEILMNQTYGRPMETVKVEVDYGELTRAKLEAMPMSELAKLAKIDEAEWAPLPELPPAA